MSVTMLTILHIRMVGVEDGDGDNSDYEEWGDVDDDVEEYYGEDTPCYDMILIRMMTTIIYIRIWLWW